jgi:catechol 2,3-dioxygenase-like lactoylglutathione lyase family enzyme
MKVLFIAGFGPIASDVEQSRRLYEDVLGITFKKEEGDYRHTEELKGANTFAVWPLDQAAESCFGSSEWPNEVVRPQAWLEFDVDDVAEATREMGERGYKLLVANRAEPWGQVVSRLISPEGLLVGLTMTPWMRKPD